MNIHYPEDIGVSIGSDPLPPALLPQLKSSLPKNLILHIYGLPFSLTNEVAQELSNVLECARVDEWLIAKSIAMGLTKGLFEGEGYIEFFTRLSFSDTNGFLLPVVDDVIYSLTDIRSNDVEKKAFELLSNMSYFHAASSYMKEALEELGMTRVVISTWGAAPPYLNLGDRPVVGCCLVANESESLVRYTLAQKLLLHSHVEEQDLNLIVSDSWKVYTERVLPAIIDFRAGVGEGIISEDSYVLDTSFLEVDDAVGTVLSALFVTFVTAAY